MKTPERFELPDTSLAPLFSGWSSGFYALPEPVTTAAAGFLALVPAAFGARQERDARYPARDRSLAEHETFARAEDAAERAREARDRALRGLEGMVGALGDEIVVGYLRVAHDEALEAVRAVRTALEGVDVTDTASVAAGGADAGPGFLAVVTARRRLEAILRARECVFDRQRLGSSWRDVNRELRLDGVLSDTRLWPAPGVRTISKAGRVTIGPVHPLQRTVWLADPANGAWLATSGEWEAALDLWLVDPQRNGLAPAGQRVAVVRVGYATRPGSRRQVPTG